MKLRNTIDNGIIERIKGSKKTVGISFVLVFEDEDKVITNKEMFKPLYQTAANTSKYMPHQGKRECERRKRRRMAA